MKDYIMMKLSSITELLQYFTGTATTTQATKQYAAAGIGLGFSVGDKVVVAGFVNSASNGTKTIATVAADAITVEEAIGAGEAAVADVTFNQEYQGAWIDIRQWAKITGSINCSGNAYIYIDQSGDKNSIDYTTTRTITGGTADSWSIETILPYVRIRVRTNAVDQTAMRAYLCGRIIT